ncbi:flagellar hook-associated protein FlgL [Hyphomicrobium nitrativorans NL23]|uniref:Flagellin n=1 Tax=Hyphomicrobium nitrativorans NL23 TaxID=1029756 RepID=V5SAF9_9HYPH|nr:flagellar hook-associated family protein [Hyphomicrobium nitrativorans]AHB47746.1 flagellar hook-associated protein FlgL [Hyphomicrobium nitrativorans NL23]
MKTTPVSTMGLINATRESRMNLQFKIAEAQKEANSGRYADVGLSIGYLAERTLSLRNEMDRLKTFKDTNSVAASRLELSQVQLNAMADAASKFVQTLQAARASPSNSGVAVTDAKAKLTSLTASLNTAVNGAYIFSGVNTDVRPMTDYPGSATQTNLALTFDAMGAPENITAADMKAFLDGAFNDMFMDDSNWSDLSDASDRNITSRITNNERIATATNSNEEPFRLLTSAYAMIADLPLNELSEAAYITVIDTAMALVGQAEGGLTAIRASLGTSQERIKSANDRMDVQIGLLNEHIVAIEGVDPYEAQVKVNTLLTQLETAYALTAKLQNLSLLKYI